MAILTLSQFLHDNRLLFLEFMTIPFLSVFDNRLPI